MKNKKLTDDQNFSPVSLSVISWANCVNEITSKETSETSFLVQGLRFSASTGRAAGSIPNQVNKIPHALWWGQNAIYKEDEERKERREGKLQGIDKSACNGKWQQIGPPPTPHLNDWLKVLPLFLFKNFHDQGESSELVPGHETGRLIPRLPAS